MEPIVIVSYSSLERTFIKVLLEECKRFAKRIVVTYGTRLYTGEDENTTEINRLVEESCGTNGLGDIIEFVSYPVRMDELNDPVMLHNRSRAAGIASALPQDDDWLLFLDADEVPDGLAMRDFLTRHDFSDRDCAYKLANYWYFMLPTLRAKQVEDSVVLVHASWVTDPKHVDAVWHPRERDGILMHSIDAHIGRHIQRQVYSRDDKPMFHHFSWVRSFPELVSKVRGWGHRNQRNWEHLLRETRAELAHGRIPVNDFVHGYELEVVAPAFHGIVGAVGP
jgi:hypothetical protein